MIRWIADGLVALGCWLRDRPTAGLVREIDNAYASACREGRDPRILRCDLTTARTIGRDIDIDRMRIVPIGTGGYATEFRTDMGGLLRVVPDASVTGWLLEDDGYEVMPGGA